MLYASFTVMGVGVAKQMGSCSKFCPRWTSRNSGGWEEVGGDGAVVVHHHHHHHPHHHQVGGDGAVIVAMYG